MSESDRHDPFRPLTLAIRSLRLLGLTSAGYGIFFVFAYGYFNRYQRYQIYFIVGGLMIFVVPGVLYIVNAMQLQEHRRRSAAVSALLIMFLQGLCAAGLFVANFFFTPISPIPVVMSALWVIALVQLFVHLWRSLPLLEIDVERRHGFEVTATPVQPPIESERGK